MANLRELVSKGTRDSLKKLTDEELEEQQLIVLQYFVLISVKQTAIAMEQASRGLVDNEKEIKEYIKAVGNHIKEDQDLFCLSKKEGS